MCGIIGYVGEREAARMLLEGLTRLEYQEESILLVARYIVANPLRSGLVAKVGDYPHWDAVWL